MSITIEKRIRAGADLAWGDWLGTSDIPPYANTDLVEYKAVTKYSIDINQVTENVQVDSRKEVIGDGIFDTLMETITRHVDAQFRQQRITGENYAQVYLGLTQTALTQAIDFVKQSKLLEIQLANAIREGENVDLKGKLLQEQIESEALNNGTGGLIETQIKNAKADIPMKLLGTELGAWTSVFNSGKVDNIPSAISDTELNATLLSIKGLI